MTMMLGFLVLQFFVSSTAFSPDGSFANLHHTVQQRERKLFAQTGPPQYDKVEAVLKPEILSKGSVLLHVETDKEIDYKPGHVLALEIEANNINESEEEISKHAQDAKDNGGWMRGPYTVSRATDKSFDVLVKVVGEKTKMFANAEAGTKVKFGGQFHVPILDGIQKETTKKIVMISTGVGIGPCVGAVELAIEDDTFPPIQLLASFKNSDEIVYKEYLDRLQSENAGRFKWDAIITSSDGRLSANDENLQIVAGSLAADLNETHFHLIGNGQMVNEFKQGLNKAGVPEDKVTIESYFNKEKPNDDVIDRIAKVISSKKAEALTAAE